MNEPAGPGPTGNENEARGTGDAGSRASASDVPGHPSSPARRARPRTLIARALMPVLVAAAVGVIFGHAAWTSYRAPASTVPSNGLPTPFPSVPPDRLSSASGVPPRDAASLAAGVDPALVDINVRDAYQGFQGAGTGIVIGSDGEVLTNNHVIEGATAISVTDIGNHRTYGATVVGYSRAQDVAVLQLTGASGLRTAPLGVSAGVAPGGDVVAVGNAEGRGGTPSYSGGSVTATDQSIAAQDRANGTTEHLTGLIATNADVVPGDSGGALVDGTGEVVGMITAGSAGFQLRPSANQGYAIPISDALTVATQIERGESSSGVHIGQTAFLGVEVQSAPPGVAGAEIVALVPGGPADRAGLVPGDTITSLGGRAIGSPDALTGLVLGEPPGASVKVRFVGLGGVPQSTTLRLGNGPAQ